MKPKKSILDIKMLVLRIQSEDEGEAMKLLNEFYKESMMEGFEACEVVANEGLLSWRNCVVNFLTALHAQIDDPAMGFEIASTIQELSELKLK